MSAGDPDLEAAHTFVVLRLAGLGLTSKTSYRLGVVARVLGVSTATIRRQVHPTPAGTAPRVRAWRIGRAGHWRVDHDELVRLVAERHRTPETHE